MIINKLKYSIFIKIDFIINYIDYLNIIMFDFIIILLTMIICYCVFSIMMYHQLYNQLALDYRALEMKLIIINESELNEGIKWEN